MKLIKRMKRLPSNWSTRRFKRPRSRLKKSNRSIKPDGWRPKASSETAINAEQRPAKVLSSKKTLLSLRQVLSVKKHLLALIDQTYRKILSNK